MKAFGAQRVVHKRSLGGRAAYALLSLALAVLALAISHFAPALNAAFGSPLLWMSLIFVSLQFADRLGLKVSSARVVASRDGVFVDGKKTLASDSFVEATYEPTTDRAGGLVRFLGRRRKTLLAVAVHDAQEACALLEAVGADVSRRCAFSAPAALSADPRSRRLGALPFALVPLFVSLFPASGNTGIMPTVAVLVMTAVVGQRILRVGRRVDVGCNALLMSGLFANQHVSIDELEDVEAFGESGVRLVRKRAAGVDMQLGTSQLLEGDRLVSFRDVVLARARIVLAQRRETNEAQLLGARLSRGVRTAVAWGQELRQLRGADRTYRSPALREDDLWTIVEDASALDDARGAAAALLLQRDPATRARLRIAANHVASPRLRVALERVAATDAAADPIDDVVTSLADEPARRSRSMSL